MPCYLSKRTVERQTIQAMLQGMDVFLPGLSTWMAAWPQADLEPGTAGWKVGEYAVAQLRHQLFTQQEQMRSLEQQAERLEALYLQEQGAHASNILAVRKEQQQAQSLLTEAHEQIQQLRLTEQNLRQQLQQQQACHARQVQGLEARIADLNRLIARQHLELVDLMGEAYAQTQSLPALPAK